MGAVFEPLDRADDQALAEGVISLDAEGAVDE